jgi:hypothetical protein
MAPAKTDPPTPPDPAPQLAELSLAEGVIREYQRHGYRLEGVYLKFAGMRRPIRCPVAPTGLHAADDEDLTPTERKIMDVLRASPVPMIRKNVAKAMNRKSALGKFATYFQKLVALGHVVRRGQEYTDDASKFTDAD